VVDEPAADAQPGSAHLARHHAPQGCRRLPLRTRARPLRPRDAVPDRRRCGGVPQGARAFDVRSAPRAARLQLRTRARAPAVRVGLARVEDSFSATAARKSAFSAFSSIFSPSWMSMARLVLPSRLELKSPDGSSSAAPFKKVSLTTLL